jgi:squalene-hopene/tetraprenyl-beta-curcumene cyclase
VLEGLHAVTRSGPAERLRLRAMQFLVRAQNSDGGWGAAAGVRSSIEETAVAIGALAHGDRDPDVEQTLCRGVAWLAAATSEGRQFPTSPIGLYFARLWYSEDLYPVIFTASAVEAVAARRRSAGPGGPAATNSALIS